MTGVGKISGPDNWVRSVGTANNGKALSVPAQVSPAENANAPLLVKLPLERAVREIATGVTDYIVSNRLTLDEGYQACCADFVSETPWVQLSATEKELVENLPQALLTRAGINPLNISVTPLGSSATTRAHADSPDIVRMDLQEILGGKPAELRIRYDATLIVSKVAVLLELINGLVRVHDEQNPAPSRSRQQPSFNLNPSLRHVLAAALGLVTAGNKTFNRPASIGVFIGREGLLTLDPTILKNALEADGNETVAVLKSMAGSFYDQAGLYVDPRILARPDELVDRGAAHGADRSRKESERRWRKDKEQLEKRYLELSHILDQSGKLRDWFMDAVERLRGDLPDDEPLDEMAKRPLPAVDLPVDFTWDRVDSLVVDCLEEPPQNLIAIFIAHSSRALNEEDTDVSIKLLLKRRIISDRLLAEKPDLKPEEAMVCLANEELLVERMEAERRKLFKNLDELSRTMTAARGYHPQFPFPPPMAAFVTSEG